MPARFTGTLANIGRTDTPGSDSAAGGRHAIAAELADLLGATIHRDDLTQHLLAALVRIGNAEGAVLLGASGNGWMIRAAHGRPVELGVEDLARGSRNGAQLMRLADEPILVVRVEASTSTVVVFPWRGPAPHDPLVRCMAGVLTWIASAGEEACPAPPVAPTTCGMEFVTVSSTCRGMLEEIDRLAATPIAVLLIGESGTGKELLARRIHAQSSRREGPFIAINCAAVPEQLIESELFGIEKGVATGVSERPGRFLRASGGTLFLDEIGDLPAGLQPKLLRALESKSITPLGSAMDIPVDVRIVAATNRELPTDRNSGAFRADLYYRLAGAVVRVPPLRERPEDVLPLARSLAASAARELGRVFHGIDLEAARALVAHDWPGNVRELAHAIRRAVALADGPVLHPALLPADIAPAAAAGTGYLPLGLDAPWRVAQKHFERLYFARLLERCKGNLAQAARIAGLARSNLYRHLEDARLR